jgi:hypothetical protein
MEDTMSHYEISYEELEEPAKHNKALQDIKDWLGEEKFHEVTGLLRADVALRDDYRRFSFLASFAGVRGYPAVAWHNHVFDLGAGSLHGNSPDDDGLEIVRSDSDS